MIEEVLPVVLDSAVQKESGAVIDPAYVRSVFSGEFRILSDTRGGGEWQVPSSLITTYDDRIRLLDRLTE